MQPSVIIVHMLSFLTDIALYYSRRLEAYKKLPENFTSRKNTNTLFVGPGWFRWNILDNFCNTIFPSTSQQTILGPGERLLSLKIPPTIPYTNWICLRKQTCAQGHPLVHIWQASLSLPVLSPFSHSFSKTGQWSLRGRLYWSLSRLGDLTELLFMDRSNIGYWLFE